MSEPLPIIPQDAAELSQNAEKQDRYRKRLKDGGACFCGEITGAEVRGLVDMGWLDEAEAKNRRAVGGALCNLIDCYLRGTLDPPISDD